VTEVIEKNIFSFGCDRNKKKIRLLLIPLNIIPVDSEHSSYKIALLPPYVYSKT